MKALSFNTQPPEGGWKDWACLLPNLYVSTHSRPKAAGTGKAYDSTTVYVVSTHSRPKAAGYMVAAAPINDTVSTHSRPKAAGVRFYKH